MSITTIETDLTEWAIQCHTRDGDLHTGRHFTTEREAIESGERLERINGAQWWLVSRRRVVTVETSPWVKTEIPYSSGQQTGDAS